LDHKKVERLIDLIQQGPQSTLPEKETDPHPTLAQVLRIAHAKMQKLQDRRIALLKRGLTAQEAARVPLSVEDAGTFLNQKIEFLSSRNLNTAERTDGNQGANILLQRI